MWNCTLFTASIAFVFFFLSLSLSHWFFISIAVYLLVCYNWLLFFSSWIWDQCFNRIDVFVLSEYYHFDKMILTVHFTVVGRKSVLIYAMMFFVCSFEWRPFPLNEKYMEWVKLSIYFGNQNRCLLFFLFILLKCKSLCWKL